MLAGASNTVQGNYVGTNAAGTADATAASIGISASAGNQKIGGTNVGEGNLVSGWGLIGIYLETANGTVVQGNLVGTTAFANELIPNQAGIVVAQSTGVTIGGTQVGAGNVIGTGEFNYGVVVGKGFSGADPNPYNVAILGNQFLGDGPVPIDLSNSFLGDGPTTNDNLDADDGPNRLQNAPVLTGAVARDDDFKSVTNVAGTLNSQANKTYCIEFYESAFGQTFVVGSVNTTTNASGNASFGAALPLTDTSRSIRATATLITNGVPVETSELSAGVAVVEAGPSVISDDTVTEGDAGTEAIGIRFSVAGTSPLPVKVNYSTLNGSAAAGEDYGAQSGSFTFNPDGAAEVVLLFSVNGDTRIEGDENFLVRIDSVENATLPDQFALATITNDGFTGTGYVNLGTGGNFVQFTTSRATAGAATVKIRFANGSTTNRPISVSVNGTVQQANVALTGNGSWTSWREVTLSLNLVAGSNAIRLTSTGTSGANVDAIVVG